MDAAERFAKALDVDRYPGRGDPVLLPDRLVRAAAVALPVVGAGLSVHDGGDLRTPLAASSEPAATAEGLEFTTGCGPCLAASRSGLPYFATEGLLARRWPIFYDLLVTRTELRSILALPLPGRFRGVGEMDLYFRDPDASMAIDVVEAREISGLVAEQLEAVSGWLSGTVTGVRSWLAAPAARRRARVWMAVGMVMAALRMDAGDGLALLRGHAYVTGRTVDDLAEELLERRIAPEQLSGDAPLSPTLLPPEPRAAVDRSTDRRPSRRQNVGVPDVDGASPDAPEAGDGHVLMLYDGERERRAGLAAWVRRGLELGEKVLCTEPPGEPLLAVLEAGGVDVAAAVRDGRLGVLAVEQFSAPEGPRGVVERALAEGFPAVRLSGDVRTARTALSAADYRESERQMDELVRTRPVSVMCQYACSTTTGGELEDIVGVHLTGVHESTLTTGGNGDVLVVSGEIDAANADVFAALLAGAHHAVSRALYLDLTGVTYLDAGAGRRLTGATLQFRAAGGQVLLMGPPPPVERILRLLDLEALPGMQLVGGDT